jgi:arylsulfatase A-like enzyme
MFTVAATACAGGPAGDDAGPGPEVERPNLVFIMADDLGYGHLGAYGGELIRTPRIDALAEQGMRFTQAYSGASVCAPSRSVLMTGMHGGHTSVRGNTGGIPIVPEDVTVGEVLQEAGYTTGLFGKWGLGDFDTTGVPWEQGFDEFFGYLHQVHAHFYYPYFLWDGDEQFILEGNEGGGREQYTHDLITARALDFVRRNQEGPFFLYLAFTIPHTELLVPEDSFAEYEGQFEEPNPYVSPNGHYADQPMPRTAFAAMVTRMDRDVGRLMDLLAELGIDESTIVIFTSDNGGQRGGGPDLDFFQGNRPLRGAKGNNYEGGIRVPAIARWPGKIEAGSESAHAWSFQDVMPTLAELGGAATPDGIDGISFVPTLVGSAAAGREQQEHPFLYWESGGVLISDQEQPSPLSQAIRMGDWKAIITPDGSLELYDLAADLGESTDVAEQNPEVVARIREILATARTAPRVYAAEEATYSYRREETGYIR